MDILTIILWFILGFVVVFIACMLILAFTTGFRRSGRLMGGLYALIGRPGEGKTYCATHLALKHMIEEGRRVFSNYAIVSVDGIYSTRVISGKTETQIVDDIKYLMTQNLNRSVLILDEAHLYFWSRNFKMFTESDKDFFTFLSQHEITCYFIVQHEDRIDTIINDCANLFGIVQKFVIPFLDVPLFFVIEWWASEDEMKNSIYHPEIKPYMTERIWFNLDVAGAYDTRAFGHSTKEPYEGITWIKFYERYYGISWIPPLRISLQRMLKNRFIVLIRRWKLKVSTRRNVFYNRTDRLVTVVRYSLYTVDNPLVRQFLGLFSFIYWSFTAWYYLIFIPSLRNKRTKYKKNKK